MEVGAALIGLRWLRTPWGLRLGVALPDVAGIPPQRSLQFLGAQSPSEQPPRVHLDTIDE